MASKELALIPNQGAAAICVILRNVYKRIMYT